MAGFFILLGGMVAFATLIGILDLIARHQKRPQQKSDA